MSRNVSSVGFRWTPLREQAAALLAAGGHTYEEVATSVGVTRRTLTRWRCVPEFAARIEEDRQRIAVEVRERVVTREVADRVERVERLNRRWKQILQFTEDRGRRPEMADIPGGRTGIVTVRSKRIGEGETVTEYELDIALLAAERETQREAARELGQDAPTHVEVTGADGGPVQIVAVPNVLGMMLEMLEEYERRGLESGGAGEETAPGHDAISGG